MPNRVLILDFESFYDKEYSLKKMPTPNYILDPRFETIMLAAKVDDGEHQIIDGPDVPAFLAQFDPKQTTTVTFNALFDNSILAWRYGFVPHTMIDPMGMARALWGHKLHRFSLKEIAEFLGLEAKKDTIVKVEGLNRAAILQAGLWTEFCEYALHDNILNEGIYLRAYPEFPWAERRLMDMVLRCCVEPRFQCNIPLLEQHLVEVKAAKAQLVQDAGDIDTKIIMSTPKFKKALEDLGVEVEMKISPATGKETPAFAKTDEFMQTLQEHDDPMIAAMAAARIGLKSTLEETRTEKLLSIAAVPWVSSADAPLMPIPLRYGAAHTHRLGGDWGMNMQNMPTVRGSKGKSKLRLSLVAPPGYSVLTIDLGQIEARMVAWLCGCTTLLEEFAKYDAGDKSFDPYNRLASSIFGTPVNRKLTGTPDEIKGFIGKTGILGLGYGCGKEKFDIMVTRGARTQGVDISAIYSREIGDRAVDVYRKRYHQIPTGWNKLNHIVSTYWLSGSASTTFGPVIISNGNILLPSGLSLKYADPQSFTSDTGRTEYRYRYGKMWHRMYGAKMLENISQALARIIVMNAALRIRDRGLYTVNPRDYLFCLQAHDELVFIVRDEELEQAKQLIHAEMIRAPSWGRDIPLVADIGTGKSYGEAK